MALTDVRLSFLAFPQRWSANALEARVLLLPAVDPMLAPGSGLPAFRGATWTLRATILPDPNALLGPDPGAAPGAVSFAFTAVPPDGAAALFDALHDQFQPDPPAAAPVRQLSASAQIRKHLPESYTRAIPFDRPSAGTTIGNEFGCALRDAVPATATDPRPPSSITWGAILSFALRQPALARALGLVHDIPFPDGVPGPLAAGGWLYVDLDPAGPVLPVPSTAVRSYAARLPTLAADSPRQLFAAVLLPVGMTTASYDEPLVEAAIYGDGFAKVVHSAQAVTADAASTGHNELPPGTDAGIDLGWDDEQVTGWLNRQLDAMRVRVATPGATALESPLGVAGYRVDVRLPDVNGFDSWRSLCRAISVDGDGNAAPVVFPAAAADPAFNEVFDDELTVEPTPVRSIHADRTAWLPQHFTRWQGGSLVANDLTLFRLTGTSPRRADTVPIDVPPPTYAAPPPIVPLRYGTRYEFRCRFADLTGGGPGVGDEPDPKVPTRLARTRFLRHVPPKPVRLGTNIPRPDPGEPTPSIPLVTTLDVWRPLIGYPELVFAGITDPGVIAGLLAAAPAARASGDAVGANDPDVTHVRVAVQVKATLHDPGPPATRDGAFRTLYTVDVPFPAFDPQNVLDRGPALTITLAYQDVADVSTIAAPAAGATNLPVPRAREVRLRLTPVCADKPDYFASPAVQHGLAADVSTRDGAEAEDALFVAQPPERELNAILLQPASDMVTRLAAHLDLVADGLRLTGRPGERIVFGASAALRHSLAGDRSSITFASEAELFGRWLGVMNLELARDWTWDGLDDEGFVIERRDRPSDAFLTIANVPVPFTVAVSALAGPDRPGADRRASTRVLFFDALDPNPPAGQFPTVLTPEWTIEPRVRGFAAADNAALKRTFGLTCPVAVKPRQTPKLVSAGIALSPYDRPVDYSSTSSRRRVLWFELDAPVEDDNDALYARVLAYGPDPLLSGHITHLLTPVPDVPVGPTTLFDIVEKLLPTPPDPPPLAIDPEPMRVIVPDQPGDTSGLDQMSEMSEGTPLEGEAPRHFIVPLPFEDPDRPEMFGFWSYELAIGHKKIWSTAQARYGRPLVIKGVQHPAPRLECTAFRVDTIKPPSRKIVVTAPFATSVFQDQRLTRPDQGDPRTRIWVLLYAQVMQADGATWRNVLLARTPALPQVQRGPAAVFAPPPSTRDVMGVAEFETNAVERILADLALPSDAPLSAIAVELLPGDHLVQQEVPIRLGDQTVNLYSVSDTPDVSDAEAVAFVAGRQLATSDPMGRELGTITSRRILRCSPLTPVAAAC